MTDLVRIGFIPGNRSKTGSRGYRVERLGKVVHVWWGGIEVRKNGSRTHYYWATGWPRQQARRQLGIEAAIRYRRSLLKKMCGTRLRYEKLPPGIRIRSRRA